MKRNLLLFTAFLVCIVLTLLSSGIPLFWDAVYYALPATNEYKSGFNPFDIQEGYDTGGFPFYALLLKIAWKLLNDTLLVTHLALLPFLLAIVFAYYRITQVFLTNKNQIWALFFLFLEPCFLTQSMLAAPDIILLSFFLLCLMCLLEKRRAWLVFFMSGLLLCNMRGIPAAVSILILDLVLTDPHSRNTKNTISTYIPAFLLAVGWFIYHRLNTGWYFFSPFREQTDEHGVSVFLMFKHSILIIWKLLDSGRIILWLFLFLGIVYFRKNKDPHFFRLLALVLIPLICFSLLFIPLSNPIGARYFMPVFILCIIPVCYFLQQLKGIKLTLSGGAISLMLIGGNFWIYPERFSNEWDTSLKVIPYFKMEKQMRNFIISTDLPFKAIGTQFPLIYSANETYIEWPSGKDQLEYIHFEDRYTNALAGPVSKFHYYLHSNVCNTDLLPQIESVKRKWKLVKEFKQGLVYISLYENPEWSPSPADAKGG